MEPEYRECSQDTAGRYGLLFRQMEELLADESDWVANLANAAALLYGALPRVNWVGFYRMHGGELLLGPFQGKPACIRISVGRGVCGTAVAHDAVQLVPDVHRFPGHIACDADSASELVIPLRAQGRVVGVLDIDSPEPGRFGPEDARGLGRIADRIVRSCRWPAEPQPE